MAQFPAMMLWTDAWVADTKHLSRLERGTYHDLLVLMWRTPGCSVPNDDEWLAKRLCMTLDEVENELRPIISEFCLTDGNRIWQKRLRKEFAWSRHRKGVASDNANRRWKKDKDLCNGNARASNALPYPTHTTEKKEERTEIVERGSGGEDLFGPEPAPPTPPPTKRAAAAKTPLPPDWQPKGEQRDLTEADEFRDHAKAKGYQYIDWDAAYRNFQKSKYNARNGNGGANGHGRRHGSVLDACDRLEQKLNAQGSFADQYVPGSSGPTPLRLDQGKRPPGLKLIPKG